MKWSRASENKETSSTTNEGCQDETRSGKWGSQDNLPSEQQGSWPKRRWTAHWSLQRRQEGTDDGCSSEFRLMSSRGSVGSASCTWIDSRNSTYARAYMECSLGFYVLYYAPQRYRLGSYHLYFDKPLTRPLAGGGRNASGARFNTGQFIYLMFTLY